LYIFEFCLAKPDPALQDILIFDFVAKPIGFATGYLASMRLGLGLRRSLICFAPLAFVPQRQERAGTLPSLLVFLTISTHFTTPPSVPGTPLFFKSS